MQYAQQQNTSNPPKWVGGHFGYIMLHPLAQRYRGMVISSGEPTKQIGIRFTLFPTNMDVHKPLFGRDLGKGGFHFAHFACSFMSSVQTPGDPTKPPPAPCGYGSNLNQQGTTGFSPCFHLPGFHFGDLFLTHVPSPKSPFEVRRSPQSPEEPRGGETPQRHAGARQIRL